jgi:heme A synthase
LGTGDFDPLYTNDSSSSSSSHAALVAGPSWRVLLSAADFVDFVHILGQLRMAVASLRFQGLWNAGSRDRRPSQAKVSLFLW